MASDKGGFDAERLGEMLTDCFVSLNEHDSNGESANVVDGLYFIGRGLRKVAEAIEKLAEGNRNPK